MNERIDEKARNMGNRMIAAPTWNRLVVLAGFINALSAGCATSRDFNHVNPHPPIVEQQFAATPTLVAIDNWTKKQVQFTNGPAILKGTIFVPDGESAVSGVVILGGSERGPRTRMKERLAEHFAGAGVAALIYDSPGTGQSTGHALLQTREARADGRNTAMR